MVISCDFTSLSYEKSVGETKPWTKHNELELLSGASRRNSQFLAPGGKYDAYYGFRTHSIIVGLDIQSPTENYIGLTDPQNCIFLNTETIEGISKLLMVYQSLLTNVPVKRGKLFHNAAVAIKPKLGREIRRVNIVTSFRPLMLSYLL